MMMSFFYRVYSYCHYDNHMYRVSVFYKYTNYIINIVITISYYWYYYYNTSNGYNKTTEKDTVIKL